MSVGAKREANLTTRRDPELTRRRLLEAATKLFAEKGRDGTSVDEICQASGVNCRMIYHYFGSKDGLYMAMLEQVYGRLREMTMTVDASSSSLMDFVDTLTERYFRFLQANPEFVAVLRWENASGAEGIRQLDMGDFRRQYFEAVSHTFDQHAEQSEITEDSLLIILTCCSLCGYFFSNQASLGHVFGVDLQDDDFSEQWLEHIKLLMRARFCG